MDADDNIQKVIIREYAPEETVVSEGDRNDRFYVVLQGTIEIRVADKRTRVLTDGDVFGIEYHYLERPYTITAVPLTESRIASYHNSMIKEILYDHPRLTQQILASLAKQVEQATLLVSKIQAVHTSVELITTPLPEAKTVSIKPEIDRRNFYDDVLDSFIKEARLLLNELDIIGSRLKPVSMPNDAENRQLSDFAQRLNRLIGGTASIGFEKFARLSRKTSLLAAKCTELKDISIAEIIRNLNLVISVLKECFTSLETIRDSEDQLPALEASIDSCMASAGIEHPELKTQEEIDRMFERKSEILAQKNSIAEQP